MQELEYSTATWNTHELHPKTCTLETAEWVFTVDLLNFSFWSDDDTTDSGNPDSAFCVEYNGKQWTGYWSLPAAINRALDSGVPITSYMYWASDAFDFDALKRLFASSNKHEVPLLRERFNCLKEAGQVLTQLGGVDKLILAADQSACSLVDSLSTYMQSFRDYFTYKGRTVYIYKRAQIFVADLWACFDGKSYGTFKDIDQLTMFADYRVPQILRDLGCIEYSPELNEIIAKRKIIKSGDPKEIEIRCVSIWAVELILRSIKKSHNHTHLNAVLIDFYLWDYAKEVQKLKNMSTSIPHRTRSCFY
ncbi:hypothetical protein CANCADRAFT_58239 [Tortispora caseinolytica NRRL Y-17796]|uniref:Queuosine 5'-phosphate N-glycosylase/hydrolase n=1 Tax=Tortispora caseinolytica NRRL Y-17796 TaxID=767744 RepID=A0A1E4TC09_9ASCO|nr:hypothetical protein CANCADRAFT_58239 [Tortispora caseinolytica NRRL Y-17796]